ncbi:MAG: 3-hydroxyacyl-CoA dehydrogenase [Pseudomonadales bacterium]|uniref:3-hydroxyacyl-CoA dehydrogenase NAD-binding domain-containing protein n=1 Tax=unclassified Ketobacter TaxID=2639109 RepID=UPI000C8995BE|nr:MULTISPECIES: 3-hydroxyacyl-CoA dehydrogenase NAD-binding domain-containing protein [unclassified Ketobacter]MAQ27607.1 3-hydroxyacyl-CoA dehydrogenase [Pseudomonadales bacterium]MEC8813010.1 3-hydroxyacyl-CoA dehydrogenase NAD-binding domain-containing protein [Pseudomonadota bacterium]HAG92961.1 3-hydroxyacyl-CoA dehydrogenase [Gammaproteobacteria bacterium]MCK5791726.1 enoyl-CoA hydratase/isomerase family protein [Ketobacter sp.]RLT89732.1 MAG: 3-hydroxyacyl-CoA dehydrogenase [Ketobacter|tara:strand:- start:40387 stop:42531 length:2145 start_codon:yes stop_codon:yes gene_type:complete
MSEAIRYEKDSDNIVVLTMDAPGQSANTMNETYKTSMDECIDRLEKEENLAGVVLTSAKKTFFAGGDLNELVKATPEVAQEFMDGVTAIKAQLRRLEMIKAPVVAAINGAALGGGYEICLACNHRIAINDRKTKIGLPEVTLGLLPGGGGVVRLTRLLGFEAAAPFLMEGKQVNPEQALKAGLIHELADNAEDMLAKAKAFCKANPNVQQPWDTKGYKVPGGTPSHPGLAMKLPIVPAMLKNKTKGCYPAPEAILSAAVESLQVDVDTAFKIEGRYFTSLAIGKVSTNMIKAFFFQLQQIGKGSSRPKGFEHHTTKKVGILGAGMMGAGIAYSSAMSGIEVVLKDISDENAQKGKDYSKKLLDKAISRGKMTQEKADGILSLIKPTANAEDLQGCDLVIEAVFEKTELKAAVTQEAEAQMLETGVMASNTSSLPITGLAQASCRPANFIGLHFFSPVDKMPLVEIICGKETSDETLAKALDYVLQIRKTPIVVNDARGFFTTRVIGTYVNEGLGMLAEGLNAASIEMAAATAGFPVGTLAISDELNLQTMRNIRLATEAALQAEGKKLEKGASDSVIDRMIDEFDRAGKLAGKGFYDYPQGGKKTLWPGLKEAFGAGSKEIPFEDMKERFLFVQSLETVRCMEEGVIEKVADANIGSIMGIGFPAWTGGVVQYINQYGLREFVARAEELAKHYGERFTPPALLIEKAEKGEQFE